MSPIISIVIPTYNRSSELKRALTSVVSQTYTDWGVVIVDNNSTDDTDHMLKSFNDSRVHLHKINNYGVIAASRNLGIHFSKGKWIAFLDSDDWWCPSKLEKVMVYCESGFDFCYHDLVIVKRQSVFNLYKRMMVGFQVKTPVFNDLIQRGNPISNSSVVVKTELIRQVGGLCEDHNLIAVEDYDCWIRLSKVTNKFKYIPEVLGYYWDAGGGVSSPKLSLIYLPYIKEHYIDPFIGENSLEIPTWWLYEYVRAMFLTGNYLESKKILTALIKQDVGFMIKLKVAYMIMFLFLKRI